MVGTVLGQMSLVRIYDGLSDEPGRRKSRDEKAHLRRTFASPRRWSPIFDIGVRHRRQVGACSLSNSARITSSVSTVHRSFFY